MGQASRLDRNRWLDALRGVAIGQVIVWHLVAPLAMKRVPPLGALLTLTWTGVDLFFVLSGFLIGGILLQNRGAENYFTVFYARRMLRILPLYFVALAVYFSAFPEPFAWYYVPLLQNFAWAAKDVTGPGAFALTWSLAVEEQFYLCLPLVVMLTPPRVLPRVLIALAAIAPLVRIACHAAGATHAAYMLLPARMDSLLIGVLIAWLRQQGSLERFQRPALIALLPLGLCYVWLGVLQATHHDVIVGTIGYTLIALFYGCLLLLVATRSGPLPRWLAPLAWLGLGAYSLYLFHEMIGRAAFAHFGPGPAAIATIAVALIAVALLCWHTIEQPLISYGHRRFRYRRASGALAPADDDGAAPMGATTLHDERLTHG